MADRNGPFSECISKMDPKILEGVISACIFDMCALEGSPNQIQFKCNSLQEFADLCYELTNVKSINWRTATGCRKLF